MTEITTGEDRTGTMDCTRHDGTREINIYSERFVDLTLTQSGREQCVPGHSYGPAIRDHYLFHYVLSGKGTLYADDTDGIAHTFTISAGEGFMIYPGQASMYVADAETPWDYAWIEFDGLCVPDLLQRTALTKTVNPVYRPSEPELSRRMVEALLFICEHPDASPLRIIAYLYEFAGYLVDSARAERTMGARHIRDGYVRTAIDFIEENYSRKIRIEDIAAECGIDRSYFGKLFHSAIGQSPQSFLVQYRMMRACGLLQETDMSIAAVGAAVGYDNALHFSRAFKGRHGMSPREWRARHRRASTN